MDLCEDALRSGAGQEPDVLRPFFSYYGSKWSIAGRYPSPRSASDVVVEPFAGSASYACHYYRCRVVLADLDPVLAGIWKYLTRVRASEVLSLPAQVESVDDVHSCEEARNLVGFWLGRAQKAPRRTVSAWGRDGRWPRCFWGEHARARIAMQVEHVRHWEVHCCDYADLPNREAVWFVDPPYEVQGRHYRRGQVDRARLAEWCRSRRGLVIACENDGAEWLPFAHLVVGRANSSRGKGGHVTRESAWLSYQGEQSPSVLVVGESSPYGVDADPLGLLPRGGSGDRLREVLGLSDVDYLEYVGRRNLCRGTWSDDQARQEARDVLEASDVRVVVLLGMKVQAAFRGPLLYATSRRGDKVLLTILHPSGRCRRWNDGDASVKAIEVLRKVAPWVSWGGAS